MSTEPSPSSLPAAATTTTTSRWINSEIRAKANQAKSKQPSFCLVPFNQGCHQKVPPTFGVDPPISIKTSKTIPQARSLTQVTLICSKLALKPTAMLWFYLVQHKIITITSTIVSSSGSGSILDKVCVVQAGLKLTMNFQMALYSWACQSWNYWCIPLSSNASILFEHFLSGLWHWLKLKAHTLEARTLCSCSTEPLLETPCTYRGSLPW